MKRPIMSSLLAAALLAAFAAPPASAQVPGLTTLEPEVVDPGAEPRQALRYRFSKGDAGAMAMEMTIDMVNTVDGAPLLDIAMVLSAELDTTVSEVYEDGSARIEQVFTRYGFDATGDPTVDAELAAASEPFVGLSMWTVIDDRGFVLDAGIDDLDTLTPELEEQVRDTSGTATALPAEAVGLGARWVADGTVVSQGVPVAMTVETEVMELTDEGVVLAMTMAGDADMAQALLGEMPAGVDISVGRFALDGGGQTAVAFDSPIPTSEADIDVEIELSVSASEDSDTVETSMGFLMLMGMGVRPLE